MTSGRGPGHDCAAQARTGLAALADEAQSAEAASGYERVLIELDRILGAASGEPARWVHRTPTDGFSDPAARIEELGGIGCDRLSVELLLALLADAVETDRA